jgi:hypothetical protein
MRYNHKHLLSQFVSPEPPDDLFMKIMRRIKEEQQLTKLKQKLAFVSFILIGSAAAFIPVFRMAQTEFSQSGFLQFFSLIFSDFGIVMSQWRSFAFALLESLPVVSLMALLSLIFVFLTSLKILAKDIIPVKNLIKSKFLTV